MNRIYVGEFISQTMIDNVDGFKDYVQVYKEETQDGTNYVAISKDKQVYALKQISNDSFVMSIGEKIFVVYPEDGEKPVL